MPLFFLSRIPTYHSFTFNLRFLYDPKHKVCLPKTMCRIFHFRIRFVFIKDIHREKAPLNETTTKNTNMDIWVVGTSNWLFLRGSKTGTNFTKKVVTGKTSLFVIDPFCSWHSICLNIGFWQSSFEWKWCVFNLSGFNSKMLLQFCEKGFFFPENLFQS